MNIPNVVIVTGKCSTTRKTFGLRVEEIAPRQWSVDWAFAIPDATAKREGYDTNQISGAFNLGNNYPGCPHCPAHSIVKCGTCQKISCGHGQGSKHTCPHCGKTATIEGYIDSLHAGGDR
jgi:hypothetical protein